MINKEWVTITPFDLGRMLHIYVPDDYETSNKTYPVLYMFDGHNLYNDQDATYGHSWRIAKTFTENKIDMIVVGLECNHEGRERLNEFCPYVCSGYLGDLDGRGTPLMKWMSSELVDYINASYRTNGINYLGGSSMGGLMAYYGCMKYPKVYQGAACLSSSIGLCMPQLIAETKKQRGLSKHRFYMSYGTEETRDKLSLARIVKNHMTLSDLLQDKGAKVTLDLIMNGHHNEATWEHQVLDFVRYITHG